MNTEPETAPEPENEIPADEAATSTEDEAATQETAEETPVEEPSSEQLLLAQIEKLQAEVTENKDRYLRSVADMENLRKRTARDKEEIRRLATSGIIEAILPVIDNLQMGLAAAANHPEAKDITVGFEMVGTQFDQILSNHGLISLTPEAGTAFDPNLHESVALQPSEEIPEQQIISVMRTGYKLNDRLLRPASVVVSSGPKAEEEA